jgi:hypothetical protein
MVLQKITKQTLLALVCCLALVLLPVAGQAQGVLDKAGQGIKKGAEGVGKGVEYGAEKTKEGAEAVGKGVKKAVTDDDADQDEQKVDREKPAESAMPADTTSEQPSKSEPTTSESATSKSEASGTEDKELPGTAGELPILALLGALAMGGSITSRFIRRIK